MGTLARNGLIIPVKPRALILEEMVSFCNLLSRFSWTIYTFKASVFTIFAVKRNKKYSECHFGVYIRLYCSAVNFLRDILKLRKIIFMNRLTVQQQISSSIARTFYSELETSPWFQHTWKLLIFVACLNLTDLIFLCLLILFGFQLLVTVCYEGLTL